LFYASAIRDVTTRSTQDQPTTRAGVDGEWVGVAEGFSYFIFSVYPGEHHLCASWQTWVGSGVDAAHKTAAARFTGSFKFAALARTKPLHNLAFIIHNSPDD